jgi:hypothetical protein
MRLLIISLIMVLVRRRGQETDCEDASEEKVVCDE